MSSSKVIKAIVVAVIALVALGFAASRLGLVPSMKSTPVIPKAGMLDGTATYVSPGIHSGAMRNLRIFLCDNDTPRALEKVESRLLADYKQKWGLRFSEEKFQYALLDTLLEYTDLEKGGGTIRTHTIDVQFTDASGHYEFINPAAGSFTLVGIFKMEDEVGMWALPIVLEPGKDKTVDLSNDNLKRMVKKPAPAKS